MTTSHDIEMLFERFGGDATSYHDVSREREYYHAREHWPLLAMIDTLDLMPAGAHAQATQSFARTGTQSSEAPGPGARPAHAQNEQPFAHATRPGARQANTRPEHPVEAHSVFRYGRPAAARDPLGATVAAPDSQSGAVPTDESRSEFGWPSANIPPSRMDKSLPALSILSAPAADDRPLRKLVTRDLPRSSSTGTTHTERLDPTFDRLRTDAG